MKRRGTKTDVFLLDCCRSLKIAKIRGGDTSSENQELANDAVYLYATAPGHPASDGDNGHGKDMVKGATCGLRICFVLCVLLPVRMN